MKLKFYPAQHSQWILRAAQWLNALELTWNGFYVDSQDLAILKNIPRGHGLILVINHADEMDIRVCLEISRRSGRTFAFMINSEAFEQWHGFAGWWLQRLGGFSVEKGGYNQTAKQYAIDIVKKGEFALVIFPEGEVFYLKELVQPFKAGAIHIGLQAVSEACASNPDWTAYFLPVAIKYYYRKSIEPALYHKIRKMERYLSLKISHLRFRERLFNIMVELLKREKKIASLEKLSELSVLNQQVQEIQTAVLSRIEAKYKQSPSPKLTLIDRAQKMICFLREQANRKARQANQKDIKDLKRIIQMEGWQPQYLSSNTSEERLAETVMKLEREVYGKNRPSPLGQRKIFVQIGKPVTLNRYAQAYQENPLDVSHQIAETLRNTIQTLIEGDAPSQYGM